MYNVQSDKFWPLVFLFYFESGGFWLERATRDEYLSKVSNFKHARWQLLSVCISCSTGAEWPAGEPGKCPVAWRKYSLMIPELILITFEALWLFKMSLMFSLCFILSKILQYICKTFFLSPASRLCKKFSKSMRFLNLFSDLLRYYFFIIMLPVSNSFKFVSVFWHSSGWV